MGSANSNAVGSGSQHLTMPQRVVLEATIHNHADLGGKDLVKYVNKHLLENAEVIP